MDYQKFTKTEANELCVFAEDAWEKAGPRTKKVRFKWRGRRFVSTIGFFTMHVDPDDGAWPKMKDGREVHLTGGFGRGPWR
jgi:hypothetical protein